MPDKSSAVVSYAAGASLAAVALIYVFGPTFAIDHDATSSRKKTIVGLRNQANDCFINSVLQAMAGLGELRVYLIRETHRRRIEDPAVYANLVQPEGKQTAQWKLQGLQDGVVTYGLKDMLDALNERPISKKAISPFQFVRVLEIAFKQRISRQQQDAQEFLQIVAERLKDEYHAGQRARLQARLPARTPGFAARVESTDSNGPDAAADQPVDDRSSVNRSGSGSPTSIGSPAIQGAARSMPVLMELGKGFPLEGKYESHLECQTCGYTTKPREETFCTLTLVVPQVASTSLNACFDGVFKTEYIDDFKCEMCRLVQMTANLERQVAKSGSESFKTLSREKIEKLRMAMETDPEQPPEDVDLEDIAFAPRRRIAKTTRMTIFPRILAIHLSRSISDIGQATQKNSAKVAFPEQLPLGGLMDQRRYKLLGLVTHRGGHNSGHYEAFRRQNMPSPYANINTFQPSEIYSKTPTPISTPKVAARRPDSPSVSTTDLLLPGSEANPSTPSLEAPLRSVPTSVPTNLPSPTVDGKDKDGETSNLRSATKSSTSKLAPARSRQNCGSSPNASSVAAADAKRPNKKKMKPAADKWWRVSDEKVREAKTNEVLGMQKEVYLLFYELEKEG